jgi:hypothetical protein
MNRNFWASVGIVVVLIAVAGALLEWRWPEIAAPAAPPAPVAAPPPQAKQPDIATPAPSFDAVHIGQDGQAVIAGRAAPDADVTVLDHGEPVAHAKADRNGEWVAMTEKPLPTGPQELSLSAHAPTGAAVVSNSSVAVVVPQHGEEQPPVAVLLPPQGAAKAIGALDARAPRHLTLDIVEYDPQGRTILSGRADPAATIDVAINSNTAATAHADASGDWSATLASGVPVGRYYLRLTGHAQDGSDAGDIAFEMRRATLAELGPGGGFAVVPGNTLWHLARRSYGEGLRYVEIYRANRDRVNNPDKIYPGQVLSLPDKT